MANLLEQAWSKCSFDFSTSCPSGHQSFQKIPKWRKVFIKIGSLPTVITNSFKILVIQKFENIFNHIFSFFFALGFILFLGATTKFMMTKGAQKKYIHFIHMLTSSNVYIFQMCIFNWKHSWVKDKQKPPLVDPLS